MKIRTEFTDDPNTCMCVTADVAAGRFEIYNRRAQCKSRGRGYRWDGSVADYIPEHDSND